MESLSRKSFTSRCRFGPVCSLHLKRCWHNSSNGEAAIVVFPYRFTVNGCSSVKVKHVLNNFN